MDEKETYVGERERGPFGGDRKGTAVHGGGRRCYGKLPTRTACMHGGPRASYPPPSRVFKLDSYSSEYLSPSPQFH